MSPRKSTYCESISILSPRSLNTSPTKSVLGLYSTNNKGFSQIGNINVKSNSYFLKDFNVSDQIHSKGFYHSRQNFVLFCF